MNKLIRSEWIKLRSLRTTWILAVLAILTAMAITGAATGSVKAGHERLRAGRPLAHTGSVARSALHPGVGRHGVLERVPLRHDHPEPRCGSDPW